MSKVKVGTLEDTHLTHIEGVDGRTYIIVGEAEIIVVESVESDRQKPYEVDKAPFVVDNDNDIWVMTDDGDWLGPIESDDVRSYHDLLVNQHNFDYMSSWQSIRSDYGIKYSGFLLKNDLSTIVESYAGPPTFE